MSKRKASKKGKKRYSVAHAPSAPADKLPKDVLDWPVVRAYVPQYEAWMATGMGTAGIVRRRPDGLWSSAYFFIGLFNGGIENMFGKPDTNAEENDKLLHDLGDNLPPYEEGDPELVARYVWGAHEWSAEWGYTFGGAESRAYLGLLPRLSGTRNWWLQQFIDEETGLVPLGLQKVMYANQPDNDLPDGKEIVIFTTAEFALSDVDDAVKKLRKEKPEFEDGGLDDEGNHAFTFTRAYPRNHWSPLSLLGGRQILGGVQVGARKLVATANVLSMETRLIARLKKILGDAIELKSASWKGIHEREPLGETFA